MSLRAILRSSALLRGIDGDEIDRLVATARVSDLADGELAFAPGDPADTLVVVLDGSVELSRTADHDRGRERTRVARRGATLGDEALVLTSGARTSRCRSVGGARVAELSGAAVVRAAARSGGDELAERVRRRARRAWARATIEHAWGMGAIEARVDAAAVTHVRPGERYVSGEGAPSAVIVAQGSCVEVLVTGAVAAHLERGDWCVCEPSRPLRALSDVWLVAVPLELAPARPPRPVDAPAPLDAHIERARRRSARSLMVLDASRCVACDACERACASAHGDGLARFDRDRSDVVPRVAGASLAQGTNACQHCATPACLPECPVSAIARDRSGRVSIDEEACTGCGACARACPWDAVRIVPRPEHRPGASAAVALKCDLCGDGSAPACVRACPESALARVDGAAATLASGAPPRDRGTRRYGVAFASASACVAAWALPISRAAGGLAVLVSWGALAAHAVWRRWAVEARTPSWWTAARLRRAHEATGALALALAVRHGGSVALSAPARAAQVGVAVLAATTLLAALARRALPARAAALAAIGAEAFAPTGSEGSEHAAFYRVLSGSDAPLKAVYRTLAGPYAASRIASLAALLVVIDPAREIASLRAKLVGRLGGHETGRLASADRLFAVAVAVRAHRAERWARAALAFATPAHGIVACVVAAVALVHGVLALVSRLR